MKRHELKLELQNELKYEVELECDVINAKAKPFTISVLSL